MHFRVSFFTLLAFMLLVVPASALDVDLKVRSVKVDHALSYTAGNLLDKDPTTAWASLGSGEGQWMEFSFGVPMRLVKLGIFNGHQGEGEFEKFRRIRSGRLIYSDGTETQFWLRDEPGEQIITCPGTETKSVRIVVDEVFPKGVHLAKKTLAVSEVKFYLTLLTNPDQAATLRAEADKVLSLPPADTAGEVPDEIKELLRTFFVRHTSLDSDYHLLFAPHVRDKYDFQFEVFKEIQRQMGTYKTLKTAKVDASGLRFDLVYLEEDVAEVRVFGVYNVKVAHLDENLEEDSVFALMKGEGGWKILELEMKEDESF